MPSKLRLLIFCPQRCQQTVLILTSASLCKGWFRTYLFHSTLSTNGSYFNLSTHCKGWFRLSSSIPSFDGVCKLVLCVLINICKINVLINSSLERRVNKTCLPRLVGLHRVSKQCKTVNKSASNRF